MPWEALQQNLASRCGVQRCKDGYSFCYDQRCRACSDLQGTEFGCQNPNTMAKCYRFCLGKRIVGLLFCYDQRCRACSDLQGTEFGCQNPHTMAKCYRFCLGKHRVGFSFCYDQGYRVCSVLPKARNSVFRTLTPWPSVTGSI